MAEKRLQREAFVADVDQTLGKDEERALVDQFVSEVKNYVSATDDIRQHWARIYDSMEGKLRRNKAYPWSSDYHTRMLRSACYTGLAFMVGREITFQFEPVGDEDVEMARVFSPIIGHQFNIEMDGFRRTQEWLFQTLMFGTGFMKCPWMTVKNHRTGKTIWDNPFLEVIPIEDVYVHPMYSDIRMLELFNLPFIHGKTVTEDYLLGQDRYDKEKIKELLEFNEKDTHREFESSISMVHRVDFSDLKRLFADKKHYKIFERITRDSICTYAAGQNGMVLLEKRVNDDGFIPVVSMKYELSSRPGRMYGVGIGDNGEEIEELYHDLLNQFMDDQRNAANNMWVAEEGALRDPRDVLIKPAGIVWTKEGRIGGVREMNRQGIDLRKEQLLNLTREKFENSTGISRIMSGDVTGSETATETDIQDRNARSRPEVSRQMIFKSLEELGGMVWEHDKKNIKKLKAINVWDESTEEYQKVKFLAGDKNILDNENIVDLGDGRIIDENGQIFDSNRFRARNPGITFALRGSYNLKVDPETTQGLNKNIIVKQLTDLLLESVNDPTSSMDKDAIRKEILKLRGLPNPERFFGERTSRLVPEVVGELGENVEGGTSFGTTAGGPNTAALSTPRGQQQETQQV